MSLCEHGNCAVAIDGKTESVRSLCGGTCWVKNARFLVGGDSSLARAPTRDGKVAGSNPRRSGGRNIFSRVDFLC